MTYYHYKLEVIIAYGSVFVIYWNEMESKGVQFPGRDASDKINRGGLFAGARDNSKISAFVPQDHQIRMPSDKRDYCILCLSKTSSTYLYSFYQRSCTKLRLQEKTDILPKWQFFQKKYCKWSFKPGADKRMYTVNFSGRFCYVFSSFLKWLFLKFFRTYPLGPDFFWILLKVGRSDPHEIHLTHGIFSLMCNFGSMIHFFRKLPLVRPNPLPSQL